MSAKIKVGLVDDHRVVRHGLQRLIEACDDLEVVGTASSGEEALKHYQDWQADVVIMDLLLPGGIDGIETTRQLKQKCPAVRVIVLTAYTDDERVIAALRAGATGYIRKEAEPEILLGAIRAAATGQSIFDPSIPEELWQNWKRTTPDISKTTNTGLTEREILVLRQVALGHTNREIAQNFLIGEETVKTHVSHLLSKLGLNGRNQLIFYALKHGLIRLDEIST
jgi:NarL family two-component system response regulator LiaR